jgi:periplasmic divalent cation tolerance protein
MPDEPQPASLVPCAIVLTTCESRANAEAIGTALVTQGLAACVQMFPIDSIYKWHGAVERTQELMLFCKIKSEDYPAVEAAIRVLHTYETPEIVEIAIEAGAPDYLRWIASVTR